MLSKHNVPTKQYISKQGSRASCLAQASFAAFGGRMQVAATVSANEQPWRQFTCQTIFSPHNKVNNELISGIVQLNLVIKTREIEVNLNV